jgi:hypothetical protein
MEVVNRPDSDAEIQETINELQRALVQDSLKLPPKLVITLPTAIRGLKELLERRKR